MLDRWLDVKEAVVVEKQAAARIKLGVGKLTIPEDDLRQGEASWYLVAARDELEAKVKSALLTSAMWFHYRLHVGAGEN